MSGMLWEVQKCGTEMQSEQTLMEKWHQQTPSMQGPHKPSICKKKKRDKKRTNPQNQKQKHSICEVQKEGVPVNLSFLECPRMQAVPQGSS